MFTNFKSYNKRKYDKKYNKKYKQNNPRGELIEIYKDTVDYFQKNQRKLAPSEKIDIDKLEVTNLKLKYTTYIDIRNLDTLDMAIEYRDADLNPLVLNMASYFIPGGGVRKGSSAQEEEIFRRTNAFQTHPRNFYPLAKNEIIYSPEVIIIKDNRSNNYRKINKKTISMVACSALRNPLLIKGKYKQQDQKLMEDKIESIFKIALIKGHDSLILGAFGCGAYYNPQEEVAMIFKKFVDKYNGYFRKIGFAILAVGRNGKINLECFSKELQI